MSGQLQERAISEIFIWYRFTYCYSVVIKRTGSIACLFFFTNLTDYEKDILLILMVVFLNNLNAQDEGSGSLFGKFYIGAKAGYGIANFESIVNSEKNFAKMTYNNIMYGIVAGYKLNGRISIQVEEITLNTEQMRFSELHLFTNQSIIYIIQS